jgi:hypothetical protein
MARQKFSSTSRAGGSSNGTPSSWSSAACATHDVISAASVVESSPLVWASQIRISTVPYEWCGRTLHQTCVNSAIELVRTRKSM